MESVLADLYETRHSESGVRYSKVELQLEFTIDNKGRKIRVELFFYGDQSWLSMLYSGVPRTPPATRHTIGRVSADLLDDASNVDSLE